MPDKWIHNFTITETSKHKKGFTIYKITSIVFPPDIPETLSKIEVWKRFSEIKKLYKEVSAKYKTLHMRDILPELKQESFFKRFEPEVIEERKKFILELLFYIAEHPVLYKSNLFLKFFDGGHSPDQSPKHNSNIATICADLDLEQPEIILLDPTRDEALTELSTTSRNDPSSSQVVEEKLTGVCGTESFDYIYEAALEFSNALQAEVNCFYKEAFDGYKLGIDRLLNGANSDTNVDRKRIAKEKTEKYLIKAEELYEQYISTSILTNIEEGLLTIDETIYLERPISHLSKYKVVRIIDTVMQVQDVTDKKFYIMKVVEKFPINNHKKSIYLPKNKIPFMVPLISYFQSENSVYLLLKQACGGKLWDYILSYGRDKTLKTNSDLRDLFTDSVKNLETKNSIQDILSIESKSSIPTINISESNSLESSGYDSGFVDLVADYTNIDKIKSTYSTESKSKMKQTININDSILENMEVEYIPSFDILSKDMDVIDLVDCSQKLLNSVKNTLEKTKLIERNQIDDFILLTSNQKTEEVKKVPELNQTIENEITNSFNNSIVDSKQNQEKIIVEPNNIMLPEGSIRQWTKELVLSVSQLHENDIVCGDLRMENLLLGGNGKIQLTFFYQRSERELNLDLNSKSMERMYVAPERPLTKVSDWWSVGVILFELLTGKSFCSCHPGGMSSYYVIQYPQINTEISEEAMNFLEGLLQSNPEQRLRIDEIKSHPFFKFTNWDELLRNGNET